MPELAAAYTVGFICCLMLTMLYVFLRDRRRRSRAAQTVQANLKTLNYFWSDSADAIVRLELDSAAKEERKSRKTIGTTGLILSLLSWLGVFFLLMIMLSERYLARSRRERKLFSSSLSKSSHVDGAAVAQEINDLDLMNDNPAEAARTI